MGSLIVAWLTDGPWMMMGKTGRPADRPTTTLRLHSIPPSNLVFLPCLQPGCPARQAVSRNAEWRRVAGGAVRRRERPSWLFAGVESASLQLQFSVSSSKTRTERQGREPNSVLSCGGGGARAPHTTHSRVGQRAGGKASLEVGRPDDFPWQGRLNGRVPRSLHSCRNPGPLC